MKALDALGNPVRRQILERLSEGPASVGALAEAFPISRPAISRHLRLLTEARLVTHERSGTRNEYTLRREGFVDAEWYLAAFWDDALRRFKLVAENLESS